MEGLAALVVWFKANELLVMSVALVISEVLGAIAPVKANGFLSFAIIKIQEFLRKKGAVDLTPNK